MNASVNPGESRRLDPGKWAKSLLTLVRRKEAMGLTSDRHDGCLHEIEPETGMQKCYLVLPNGQRRDLVRPVRRTYVHLVCGAATTMAQAIAETYAANPSFYSGTYCVRCKTHLPVGKDGEFVWDGTDIKVGT